MIFYHPESSYYFNSINPDPETMTQCIAIDPHTIPAHTKIYAGNGFSTVLPDMDFETFSEADIGTVGGVVYSEHPSTEVISLAYDLKDGIGPRLWVPGMKPPTDLFYHIIKGGLIEAWNTSFEYHIWENVCHRRMGWPQLPFYQLRDAMAKARAFSLPGALGNAGNALNTNIKKMTEGKNLIRKFCVPRKPTKHDHRTRIRPEDDVINAAKFYEYNIADIQTEADISARIPDLISDELNLWLLDQKININGVQLDLEACEDCSAIVYLASEKYTSELMDVTNNEVLSAGENAKMMDWMAKNGWPMPNMQAETVRSMLKKPMLPPHVKRVLEIRSILGSASVAKLAAMQNQVSRDGRIKHLFAYCGADRTGRWAGRGPQPQNLPNSGPKVKLCNSCGAYFHQNKHDKCPMWYCGSSDVSKSEWGIEAAEFALSIFKFRDLSMVESIFGDAIDAVAGCLRTLFVAAPGKDLICSDYSAIEAVVLAQLAGEEWRLEVFRTHGKIYEMSASKITGIPFDEFTRHKQETGDHHPMRKKVGKVAELASGYQGGLGAWKNFGADEFMSEDEIRENIKKWRAESPAIVAFWYGLEDAAKKAIQMPGHVFAYRDISYGVKEDVLYCMLPSGRTLKYHSPRLVPDRTSWGKEVMKITYMGVDSIKKTWVRQDTYGGKLTENVVQAVSRDILAYALTNLDNAGYHPVLHVHDEIVSEVPEGFGSVEEFESIMATFPDWAKGWPLKAAGGWRGKRYRKD